ncbi:hypothetical protein PtA15_11A294 [Puccinia triticina]|uniref:Uncharacterized protein n=1 Tax=Puccinia triticina TaxID=208348 RepID=A0ABY7CYB1_9BASI|nr:uncharacterized protein PtA15_11A294 [Puccinia triticina]WAQ89604.1 hypothetical protein PtA15_11A294 [Puccinia triticina]
MPSIFRVKLVAPHENAQRSADASSCEDARRMAWKWCTLGFGSHKSAGGLELARRVYKPPLSSTSSLFLMTKLFRIYLQ